MKKFALLLSFALIAAGVASADETKKPADAVKAAEKSADKAEKAAVSAEKSAGKTHELAAEIVAADAAKSTITIKGEKENKVVTVDTKAAATIKDLKPGDKVTLTCWDNEKGEHVKAIAIVTAKGVAAPEKK